MPKDKIPLPIFFTNKVDLLKYTSQSGVDPGPIVGIGGSRIFGAEGRTDSQSGCANLSLCKSFVENCVKMNTFDPRGGGGVGAYPLCSLVSANGRDRQSLMGTDFVIILLKCPK